MARKPQDSRSLFRAAAPAEATPESTSAVLEDSHVQFIREAPQRALHRADQVENIVLVPCRDQLAKRTQPTES